jgi:serine protease Do
VTPDLAKRVGSHAPDKGALVGEVQPGSPAEKAGLKPRDIIVDIDKTPVTGSKSVQKTVLGKQIGQKVNIGVWRDGKTMNLAANLSELPGDDRRTAQAGGPSSPKAKLGLGLQSLTPELSQRLGVPKGQKGAVVTSVREGSPAQEAGLQEGDVILEVDRKPVGAADDAIKLLQQDQPGGHLLRVKRRDGGAMFVVIPSP